MNELPQRFLDDMKKLLMDEYDDFIKSYEKPKTTGLRVNTLKMSKEELLNLDLYNLSQIPWSDEGFYYNEEVDRPGKSPLHESGAYYLQEPSAMSVVPYLDIKEGDKVLDMCASPGGKSTYILSKLNDTGLLVSNEINPNRIKALGENLERFGARNCIITNTDSNSLRKVFTGYFDKIVIDAPCSGQGMFRKDEFAIKDWSYEKVLECQSIQKEIIRDGYDMLNMGGILVYSTCTFSKEENEDVINEFISEYEDAKLIEMKRIWPHKVNGEGHFVAKIQKLKDENCNVKYIKIKNNDKEVKDYREFEKNFLNIYIYDEATVAKMDPALGELELPGWDTSYGEGGLGALLDQYKDIDEEKLWSNLEYFIKGIMPTAEEEEVKMAIHPDDPPWGIFGLPRIITNFENLDRFLNLYDSHYNGVTLCTGSLGCTKTNDVVKMIKHFGGERNRIHFAHLRNVLITGDSSFNEVAHLSEAGSLDFHAIVKAYLDYNFDGPYRPDHGRMIWGETGRPGYGLYDRALGAVYVNGLKEAILKETKSKSGCEETLLEKASV